MTLASVFEQVAVVLALSALLSWCGWLHRRLAERRPRQEEDSSAQVESQRSIGITKQSLLILEPNADYDPTDGKINNSECPVCLVVYEKGDRLQILQQCGHGFHHDCLMEWVRTCATCPICRVSLDEEDGAPAAAPSVAAAAADLSGRGRLVATEVAVSIPTSHGHQEVDRRAEGSVIVVVRPAAVAEDLADGNRHSQSEQADSLREASCSSPPFSSSSFESVIQRPPCGTDSAETRQAEATQGAEDKGAAAPTTSKAADSPAHT
eukprot:TRINITY_DN625_c0_g1_i1.p1 TRINITY_DN625_c0_g1~~TRINITY_DN625_c0_g1_i1.p1  ORF type:complete len:265 (+),score=41.57 TRINITY_DN625_c0_g1_i1:181-975(+)